MELYFSLSGLFNAVTSTLLGLLVFFKNRESKINQTFALFCLSVAAWSYAYMFWPIAKDRETTLFWFQLLHIGANFTSITYLHFVVTWLNFYKEKKRIIIFGYFLAFIFSSLVFSSNFIADMVPKFSMRFWAEPGVLYHLYLTYFLGYAFYSSYFLFINYKKTSGTKRAQMKYILIGMVLAFMGGSTNYLLWYDINFPPYGNILASSYVILSAYAIVVHRLMDIKFVLRKSLVYVGSLSTIMVFAVAIKYFAERYLYNYDIKTWADVLILIAAVTAFIPIKSYYYHIANKYFFTSLYDSRKVIASLSVRLSSTLEVKKINRYISDTLRNSFHSKAVSVLICDKETNDYIVQYNKGFKFKGKKTFGGGKNLQNLFIKQKEALVIEEIVRGRGKLKYKKILNIFTSYGAEIIMPLNLKDKIIGLIVLGQKESGGMYNNEDLGVLKIIGAQAAIAIENALLYEETKDFTIKLKKEVQKATVDLKIANQQLKKLDAAKSNFISIASHQLRTPLTVIKGYISMMIEGSFGKLTKEELESLKKVYESNERLIQLVEDLLNISRIESGKLQFDFQEACLEEVVGSVVEELAGSARRKGLRLTYKKPNKLLPKVKIDGEKIRYVVLNLIDNAVKYTKQGSIAVSLKSGKKHIHFCVADTGMGINKEDFPNLFKKFSRGKDTSIVHPEGTGMGLYVGRMMIKAHHGKIWVESKGENKGSRFCFNIPVSRNS